MRLNLTISFMLFASVAVATEDCSTVIALSRVSENVQTTASEVQAHANNFCNEYQKYNSQQSSHNFGASYKFLQASYRDGNASVDQVASRYCSAEYGFIAKKDAYYSYVQTIAPGAFTAYQACLKFKENNGVVFSLDEAAILPDNFSLLATFQRPGSMQAHFRVTASRGISCKWNGGNSDIKVVSPWSGALFCVRSNISKKGFVQVTMDNDLNAITLPWESFSADGVPVSFANDMRKAVADLSKQLDEIQSNRTLQTGTFAIRQGPLSGDPKDGSQCSLNERGTQNGRIDFDRPFVKPPKVIVALRKLDVESNRNSRIDVQVKSVDNSGFNYSFVTWCDTIIHDAAAVYFAAAQ